MFLLVLNILFAFIGGYYLLFGTPAPTFVAFGCLIVGGLVFVSRFLAWTTGAAQAGYAIANAQPSVGKMKRNMAIMEALFWALGLSNVSVYAFRYAT